MNFTLCSSCCINLLSPAVIYIFVIILDISLFLSVSSELPVIQSHPPTLDVILNNPITLPCRATGSPRPTITWQKEGINIPTTGNSPRLCVSTIETVSSQSWHHVFRFMLGGSFTVLPNGSLRISKASVSDSGTYICVAQNPAGTALGKTKLKVQGGSHTPSNWNQINLKIMQQ